MKPMKVNCSSSCVQLHTAVLLDEYACRGRNGVLFWYVMIPMYMYIHIGLILLLFAHRICVQCTCIPFSVFLLLIFEICAQDMQLHSDCRHCIPTAYIHVYTHIHAHIHVHVQKV